MSSSGSVNSVFRTIRSNMPGPKMSIFLGTLITYTGLTLYDRNEIKKIIEKSCKKVSHLASEPIGTLEEPRTVRIWMASPPGDDITPSQKLFRSLIKPILCAAAVEYDILSGDQEGDLKIKASELVTKVPTSKSSSPSSLLYNDPRLAAVRKSNAQSKESGGEIIIGRHTWRDFVLGLHEGCLKPNTSPGTPEQLSNETASPPLKIESSETEETKVADEQDLKKQKAQKLRQIDFSAWSESFINPIPSIDPCIYIAQPHLLGFLNMPWRLWRFINKRSEAEIATNAVVDLILSKSSTPLTVEEVKKMGEDEELDWPSKLYKRENADQLTWTCEFKINNLVAAGLRIFDHKDT